MSISVAAARSRDQTNLDIIASYDRRRVPSPPSFESASQAIPTTLRALPTMQPAIPLLLSDADQSVSVRHMLNLTTGTLGRYLQELTSLLNCSEICAPCWVHNRKFDHQLTKCTDIGVGYRTTGSKHKAWKASFNLPKGVCFRCCLPQVSVLVSVSAVILRKVSD